MFKNFSKFLSCHSDGRRVAFRSKAHCLLLNKRRVVGGKHFNRYIVVKANLYKIFERLLILNVSGVFLYARKRNNRVECILW